MIYVLIMISHMGLGSYNVQEVATFEFKPMCDRAAKGHTLSHENDSAFVCIGRKVNAD